MKNCEQLCEQIISYYIYVYMSTIKLSKVDNLDQTNS